MNAFQKYKSGAAKGLSQTTMSMTGHKTMQGLTPSVPGFSTRMKKKGAVKPLDKETKEKMNESLNNSYVQDSKPGFLYAEFEGGDSTSQKNLEFARSRFLLDKLTGKLDESK